MATVPQSTLNWLYDVLRQLNYRDLNRTYSDLAQTLQQFPSIAPRSNIYTSDTGATVLLVKLEGTIPVNFRGTLYKFPLTLWIPNAYPYEAPFVFVAPADDMMIRQGQHVSGADGKVYHHYLAGWRQAWERSNVVEFLRIMSDVFSREPPVKARPQGSSLPPQYGQRPAPTPPSAPSPVQQHPQRHDSHGYTGYSGRAPPPPPPPKQPPVSAGEPQSMSGASPSPAPKPSRYDRPPPLPGQSQPQSPRPQSMYSNGHIQQPYIGGQRAPQRTSYDSGVRDPVQIQQYQSQPLPAPIHSPTPYPPQVQSPGLTQSHQSHHHQPFLQQTHYGGQATLAPDHPSTAGFSNQALPLQGHQVANQRSYPSQHYQQDQAQPQHQVPVKKAPQRDLLSEEDPFQLSLPATQSNIPVPSIPPNPEKAALLSHLSHQILQHLHQSINQNNSTALPSLQSQNTALTAAQQSLSQEIQHLQSISSHLSANIAALTSTIKQANTTISSTKNPTHPSNPSNIPPIDDIIMPPTVIARQLYDNVAEQRGYEAAVYALNEAFVRGRIGSEVWGRKVRECTREEFRRKWMIKRIGEGLGLDAT